MCDGDRPALADLTVAPSPAKTAVLLQLDPDLLARLDKMWPAVGHPSRRAAIRHAIETMLAQHAAHVQRERTAAAEPNAWPRPAPRHSADTTAEQASRPITAGLGPG